MTGGEGGGTCKAPVSATAGKDPGAGFGTAGGPAPSPVGNGGPHWTGTLDGALREPRIAARATPSADIGDAP